MRHIGLVLALAACLPACGSGLDGTRLSRFERFTLSFTTGPCPSGMICGRSITLGASGTLSGNEGHVLRQAQVSSADLAAALRVLTAPALLALLENPPPCQSVGTDGFETMELEFDGRLRTDEASACRTEAPAEAARAEMGRLKAAYFR
jgi:hypothetical protein